MNKCLNNNKNSRKTEGCYQASRSKGWRSIQDTEATSYDGEIHTFTSNHNIFVLLCNFHFLLIIPAFHIYHKPSFTFFWSRVQSFLNCVIVPLPSIPLPLWPQHCPLNFPIVSGPCKRSMMGNLFNG